MRYDRVMDMRIIATLAVTGLALGSFAGAQIWRLRARELLAGSELTKSERAERRRLTRLTGKSLHDDRSICLHCGHVLAWYDLIPLFSWLSTAGKCRYCNRAIGMMEPLIELGMSLYLVSTYLVVFGSEPITALTLVRLVAWIAAGVCIAILYWYDLRWSILPLSINLTLIGASLVYAAVTQVAHHNSLDALASPLLTAGLLGGIYWLLYVGSGGRWVGGGDYKLALGLGLLVGDWRLALVALFAANIIGCLIVLPGLLSRQISTQAHIPFGPLLIAGFLIALYWSQPLLAFFADYLLL